ncbi:MAG: hypothetical protein L0I76_17435 [Pseudonocardia sp.]|nr:hypothetical protein [Pseudonocardia sp.]
MRAARLRQAGLALVMVGALSVSVRGQVQAVAPLLGGMGVVLALTNDLAALLALNELISTRRPEVRRWAWAVLVLAGGTAAGLNTWHAIAGGQLPAVWAVVVGIGPVLLAVLLSHLVALVLDHPTPSGTATSAATGGRPDTAAPVTDPQAPAPQVSVPQAPVAPAPYEDNADDDEDDETTQAGQVTVPLTGPGSHHGLAVVRAAPLLPPEAPWGLLPAEAPLPGRNRAADPSTSAAECVVEDVEDVEDGRVARAVAQLRAGCSLTGADVAEREGCSDRTGRRVLQQAQQHLDAAPAPARVTG